ncbi:Probable metabolite transport protein GIT1 [Galdieria sulphuraria]|nr:Probable metabolite transport protein GIT1 [Galdieria sulphuraria]
MTESEGSSIQVVEEEPPKNLYDRVNQKLASARYSEDNQAEQYREEEVRLYGGFRSPTISTIVSGIGFFSEAYDLYVVNVLSELWKKEYPTYFSQNSSMISRIGNSAIVGAIIGQLFFGLIGDRVGRKAGLLVTSTILFLGPVLSSVSFGANGSINGLFWMLVVVRGFLGVGIGGEYPCASVSAAEAGDDAKVKRGKTVLFVFSMQGVGQVVGIVVAIIALLFTKSNFHVDNTSGFHAVWRFVLAFGALPIIPVFVLRTRMRDSLRFRIAGYKRRKVPMLVTFRYYWIRLVGTAGCWFLNDIVQYSNGIFSSEIITGVVAGSDKTVLDIAMFTLLVAILTLPGYYVAALTVDKIGHKRLQIIGFACVGLCGILIGGLIDQLENQPGAFILMYGIFLFFVQFGSNTTTFLLAAELYSTPVRTTCAGISAAFGKAGAAIGTQFLGPIEHAFSGNNGVRAVFIIAGGVSILGALLTWWVIPEPNKRTLEDEDFSFAEYCIRHGVDAKLFSS